MNEIRNVSQENNLIKASVSEVLRSTKTFCAQEIAENIATKNSKTQRLEEAAVLVYLRNLIYLGILASTKTYIHVFNDTPLWVWPDKRNFFS